MIPTRAEPCKAMKSSTSLVTLSRVWVEIDRLPRKKSINSSMQLIKMETAKSLNQSSSKYSSSLSTAPIDYDLSDSIHDIHFQTLSIGDPIPAHTTTPFPLLLQQQAKRSETPRCWGENGKIRQDKKEEKQKEKKWKKDGLDGEKCIQLNYIICKIQMGQENETCSNICESIYQEKPRDKLAPNLLKKNKLLKNPNNHLQFSPHNSSLYSRIYDFIHAPQRYIKPPVTFPSGAIYTGQWENNQINGQGNMKYADGSWYEGQWAHNLPHGKGLIKYSDSSSYEGEWREGNAQGFGIFRHATGAYYQGYWKQNLQNGRGIQKWADQSRFEGSFLDGRKNGQGKYQWADGSSFNGDWVDGEINGKGKFIWADGKCYDGSWKHSKMHGYGRYTWKDGRVYEGYYVNDKKHGKGTFYEIDGRVFEGEWRGGKRTGRGKIRLKNGEEREGVWQNDKHVRWLEEEGKSGKRVNFK